MNIPASAPLRTLDEQRVEFARRRFLAMPLAGAMAWTLVGVAGLFLRPGPEALVLFAATGSILYLGLFLSRFTGENLTDRAKPKNVFDGLFLRTVAMCVLVYAIGSLSSWPTSRRCPCPLASSLASCGCRFRGSSTTG